jgi:hypothetical protein
MGSKMTATLIQPVGGPEAKSQCDPDGKVTTSRAMQRRAHRIHQLERHHLGELTQVARGEHPRRHGDPSS